MTPTLAEFLALREEKPRTMSSRLQQDQADPQIRRFEGLYFTRLSTFFTLADKYKIGVGKQIPDIENFQQK